MTILRQAGLVKSRKEERWMYYRLPIDSEIASPVSDALKWTFTALATDKLIADDRRSLKKNAGRNLTSMCHPLRNQ
jgi:DNA-binding transcriptional ArsR family regulator